MKRRIAFALLVLLFVAFCAWRISWFPYAPEQLRAAVSPQAAFVSEHAQLAGRWATWVAHPVVRSVALGLGVPRQELDRIARDPGTRAVLDRLAARDTLTAYEPEFGRTGEPAWIVASWVGFQGQLLRWGVYKALLADFEACTFADGRRGWRYRDREHALGARTMSFAVADGVLLGCLSGEPDGVSLLVNRVERRADYPELLRTQTFPDRGGEMDRVVFGDLGGTPPWRQSVGVWSCLLNLESDARASGMVRGPVPQLPGLGVDTGGASEAGLAQLLRDTPGALIIGPSALIGVAENLASIGPAVRLLWEHLQALTPPGGHMFLSVTQPEYGGRILGFKVATAMLGIELVDGAVTEEVIPAALDAFNARFNTTLIRRAVVGENGAALTTVESVRSGPLSGLVRGERPSYVTTNGWLLISSSGDALDRMLSLPAGGTPTWARELAAERGGAMAWVDLAAAADALTKIAALQDLVAMARGRGREVTPERQRLAVAQAWLAELRTLERLRLWVDRRDGADELQFQLGLPVARAGETGKRL